MAVNRRGQLSRVVALVEGPAQAHLQKKDALAARYIHFQAECRRGRYFVDFWSSLDVPARVLLLDAAQAISFFPG
jgi:hypothetical protein